MTMPHLQQVLGPERRPDHKWLICGPKASGSVFHIDPNATNAWNACVRGRKKWILYPPGHPPPGVLTTGDGADVTLPMSLSEWFLAFWRFHEANRRLPAYPAGGRPVECVVEEGEMLFVPHGWCVGLNEGWGWGGGKKQPCPSKRNHHKQERAGFHTKNID